MSKKSWSNGARDAASGLVAGLIAAPAAGHFANSGIAALKHFEIPPQPLKPATVAAPAANGHEVQNAEAAPQKRKAARTSRGRVSASRAQHSRADRSAIAVVDDRSAAARDTGETSAQAGCSAAAPSTAVAASDDANGKTAAGTASLDPGRADREASADAALPQQIENDMPKPTNTGTNQQNTKSTDALKVPTNPAALLDGPAYVRAVAMHVDLVGASARLVVSTDEKVSKAELDRLRELIFGKGGPQPADETLRIDWAGIPRPDRERKKSNEE